MECDECRDTIPLYREHEFESVRGKRIGRYCDACCPRCWSGRREIPEAEQ